MAKKAFQTVANKSISGISKAIDEKFKGNTEVRDGCFHRVRPGGGGGRGLWIWVWEDRVGYRAQGIFTSGASSGAEDPGLGFIKPNPKP